MTALFMGVIGTLVQTEFVLGALIDIGAIISPSDRWRMRWDDLIGLGPAYGALCFVGFFIAFISADRLAAVISLPRLLIFAVAGGVCLAVMLVLSSEVFFGSPIIAGTRSLAGFLAQIGLAIVCGIVAGRGSDRS